MKGLFISKATDEIALLLIDHFNPQAPKEWIDLQRVMELPVIEQVKWAYFATTGKTFEQCKNKVEHVAIYQGSLKQLVTARPDFLRIKQHYDTIDEAIDLGELLVLAGELALIDFDGQDYVLICLDSLVEHYRSLYN